MVEKIKYASVEELMRNLENLTKTLKGQLTIIDNANNLIGSDNYWSGEAASNYVKSYKKTSKQYEEILKELSNINTYLSSTVSSYKKVDEEVVN